jgi:hypothetical protein
MSLSYIPSHSFRMHNPTTVLQQVLAFLPEQQFQTFVGQHDADKYVKTFSCWNQLTTMLYAQATQKDSLRDIETGLTILDSTWNGLGLRSVARSTMAYANKHRPAEIYESLFYVLVEKCEGLLPKRQFSFKNPMRAFDSTTIDLCLSLFDWAKFRKMKGAIKLHTSFDIRSQIPDLVDFTTGKVGDVTALKHSHVWKRGKRRGVNRFFCKDCSQYFNIDFRRKNTESLLSLHLKGLSIRTLSDRINRSVDRTYTRIMEELKKGLT